MRKFIATTAAGLALATGSIAVATLTPIGSAFAQDGAPAQTQPATQDGAAGHGHLRRQVARAAIKDAAGVIGIDAKDLATAVRGGQSVAEVATAHGVNPQAVIDKLVADGTTRIDAAATAGKITPERATQMKSHLTERVTKLVNHHFDGSHRPATKPAG